MHSLNKHIYAVHVTVLLCVFSHDNEEKMPVKQITNWIEFGEIQTATTTFIACLTRFRLISYLFENLHGIPTGPWGLITVPIPIPYPWESLRESPDPGVTLLHGIVLYTELDAQCDKLAKLVGRPSQVLST